MILKHEKKIRIDFLIVNCEWSIVNGECPKPGRSGHVAKVTCQVVLFKDKDNRIKKAARFM